MYRTAAQHSSRRRVYRMCQALPGKCETRRFGGKRYRRSESGGDLLILDVIGVHANRSFNHLGGENAVAEAIVGQCTQIIPLCRAICLVHTIEHIGRILIGAKIDEVAGSLKFCWPGLCTCALLILVILITAKAKVAEKILIGIATAFTVASAGVATIVSVTAIGPPGRDLPAPFCGFLICS